MNSFVDIPDCESILNKLHNLIHDYGINNNGNHPNRIYMGMEEYAVLREYRYSISGISQHSGREKFMDVDVYIVKEKNHLAVF